eukprot:CAMPEP_0201243988 /NCGR_PEP_ID=MMETSP0852-20130820/43200_1 /ASSEMBLY_ACC=CAM_ASM_000632 /TAXON_ID=183588 /ORGANISM="Pseudo-nitzschia fraudulenta, Strain WWA7" /LENGTH=73 /DNA_ID=CAMNT_0047541229 /DNA_START=1 /DNA_END=222 /DNA_ORIENTATION=-
MSSEYSLGTTSQMSSSMEEINPFLTRTTTAEAANGFETEASMKTVSGVTEAAESSEETCPYPRVKGVVILFLS